VPVLLTNSNTGFFGEPSADALSTGGGGALPLLADSDWLGDCEAARPDAASSALGAEEVLSLAADAWPDLTDGTLRLTVEAAGLGLGGLLERCGEASAALCDAVSALGAGGARDTCCGNFCLLHELLSQCSVVPGGLACRRSRAARRRRPARGTAAAAPAR
jgi:hypothetical protein